MKWYSFIATGGGAGFLPKAPGTWGSGIGLLLFLAISPFSFSLQGVFLVLFFLLGVYSAQKMAEELKVKDPKSVVIDEILGQMVSLWGISWNWKVLLAAFFLFRFFDIVKIPPIRQGESLPGGLGIMMDDLLAGIMTNILLRFFIPILLS